MIEENNYYPFGLKHEGYNNLTGNPTYQYKYNGKELQESGMYDYGARFYMPDIGRWSVIDPLAEARISMSPFNYVQNNPINRIDPTGMVDDDYRLNKDGTITLLRKTNDNFHRIYNSNLSDNIKVGEDFFNSKTRKDKNTIFAGKNIDDLSNAYEFFAKNSDVEWSYGIYSNDKDSFGVLNTSHKESSVNPYVSKTLSIFTDYKLIYKSHSHPGVYNENTTYPAYPSGFNRDLSINYNNNGGDRSTYKNQKAKYGNRIPNTYNILVSDRPDIKLDYNDKQVWRIIPQTKEIKEIVITKKKKK